MPILAAIDPTYRTKKILAVSKGSWGAVAESNLVYDPGSLWNSWLITRFFEALVQRMTREKRSIEDGRAAIVEAARHALALEVPSDHGSPCLMFTVLVESQSEWWVYNVGPNLVFQIGARTRIAVPPHSALERLTSGGDVAQEWRKVGAAFMPTLVAGQTGEWESDLRSARITPGGGDWILVAAHSEAGHEVLRRDSPPRSRADVESIVEMLAKPYANYPRTWIAAHA